MKILFVWSAAEWSIYDVARGYRNAFVAAGHTVFDFKLFNRIKFAGAGLGTRSEDLPTLSRVATEGIAASALYTKPDLVFVTSGLSFHPNGLWLLRELGIPVVTLFTESPYDDAKQVAYAEAYPEAAYFTTELASARKYNWRYMPHAYDPAIHYPRELDPEDVEQPCDVLVLGTGWGDRQRFLEHVDWTGINLRVLGPWPDLTEASPLWQYHKSGCIDNDSVPDFYASAKIVINQHRESDSALSMNPRTLEVAACGAFQLSSYRQEVADTFGASVPTYRTPAELGEQIRYYMGAGFIRDTLAGEARDRVAPYTFEANANKLLAETEIYYEVNKRSA